MTQDQPKPAGERKRKWASQKSSRLSKAKEAAVMAVALTTNSQREVARRTGVNRETVARILSQPEYNGIVESYRSKIADEALPVAFQSLMKLLRKADRMAVMQTLFGTKVLSKHHELEFSQVAPQRDYADAKIKFYYEKGRWPTLEEAKEFDKTIPVKLLLKANMTADDLG